VEALAGPVVVAAALVALAGAMKVLQPAPTAGALRAVRLPSSRRLVRVLGVGEVVLAVAAAATFARPLLVLLAAAYLGFAAFVVAALDAHAPVQSCGCFGRADTPPSAVHVGLNLCAAGVLFAAALTGTPGLDSIVPDQPWSAVPFALLVAVCTYLCVIVLTLLPMTLRSSATT
jgi:hypothetical protein